MKTEIITNDPETSINVKVFYVDHQEMLYTSYGQNEVAYTRAEAIQLRDFLIQLKLDNDEN